MSALMKRDSQGRQRSIETVGDLRRCAREDAQNVLDLHWDGKLPIDPIAIAGELGPNVFSAQLGDDTYGMIIGSPGGADIYIDVDQSEPRFRFTCAHELGHYVDHSQNHDMIPVGEGYVDRRSDEGRGNPDEVYANEFAASLLMPEREVKKFAKSADSIFELADRFNVSLSAMTWRLRHLGVSLG